MSKIFSRVLGLILIALVMVNVQSTDIAKAQRDIFKDVENALALGNAKSLEEMLSSSVELELPGEEEGIYSRYQTIAILGKFFDRFPPASFKLVHTGHSAAGARFAVGDYITESDRSFRVTIFAKKQGDQYKIQEIEFE